MAKQPLHDTLTEARVPDADGVITKWRSVRKDNVLAAARTIRELGELLRSIHARENASAPQTPAASGSDLAHIRKLLVDYESRISSGTERVKRLADAVERRTGFVNYWFAAAVGIGVAAIVFAVVLLILHTQDLI